MIVANCKDQRRVVRESLNIEAWKNVVAIPPAVVILEIGGEATLAFEAITLRHAKELCNEHWLRTELREKTTGHRPLWDGKAAIRVRHALSTEQFNYLEVKAENATDNLALVYLVRVDDKANSNDAVTAGSFPPRR